MTTLPLIMTEAGPQPTPPATLNAAVIAAATALAPGLSVLPAGLIEDLSSTGTALVAQIDQARVEAVNAVSPLGANPYVLNVLGQQFGIPLGQGANGSVYVVFSGPPGYIIGQGFLVSDGTYQYQVMAGGAIAASGQSAALYCQATTAGTWAIPSGSVTVLATSVPAGTTITCTNPTAGTPGTGQQDWTAYLSQVQQAFVATATGLPATVKTALAQISGVNPTQIAVRQSAAGWEIICGGGDPYQIGYAILAAFFDFPNLVGSVLAVSNITKANPAVVTTDLKHGYTSGQIVQMTGILGMTPLNNVPVIVTVLNPTQFSIGLDTRTYPPYLGGGVLTPNPRNVTVNLTDYPDTYQVTFVAPVQQLVAIVLEWNTIDPNFVSPAAMQTAGAPALVDYVNSIAVGQPLNLFELQNAFQTATAALVPTALLTRMDFAVSVDGIVTAPAPGTGTIYGDPEGYWATNATLITIAQG